MKTEKSILISVLLNLAFSVFEFAGGIFTGSVAIISDALHDLGDAAAIGISYYFEKKSKNPPDETYTYGYTRFSLLGGAITTIILISGSLLVIYNAVLRLINPTEINHNGMIIFAIAGVIINSVAAFFTRKGDSLNQKAVNLHMLEDVLGWVVVLLGAIIIKFTHLNIIDPIMSMGVAIFIFVNAIKTLTDIILVFLEKTPDNIDTEGVIKAVADIENVLNVHHVHIRSIDGYNNCATMHVVTNENPEIIKKKIRSTLLESGISHVTIELEQENEPCSDSNCTVDTIPNHHHHHHHHH